LFFTTTKIQVRMNYQYNAEVARRWLAAIKGLDYIQTRRPFTTKLHDPSCRSKWLRAGFVEFRPHPFHGKPARRCQAYRNRANGTQCGYFAMRGQWLCHGHSSANRSRKLNPDFDKKRLEKMAHTAEGFLSHADYATKLAAGLIAPVQDKAAKAHYLEAKTELAALNRLARALGMF
jgi:hypothetical protein